MDVWLICLVMTLVIISILPVILFAFSWIAVFMLLGLLGIVIYCFLSTKYIISNDVLIIKCGGFTSEKINIMDIVKILPIKSILSAPATSFDRIGIYLNKQYTPIIISPRNKKEFVEIMQFINPQIISKI